MKVATPEYDEMVLKGRLSGLDRRAKTAFTAACAESLVALHERYWTTTGDSGKAARAREILDSAWDVAFAGNSDVSSLESEAVSLGPTDDEEWSFDKGYAQNAAAALAYAVRTWLSGDAQEAAWAARQVYEAAEYSGSQPDVQPGELLVRKVSDVAVQIAVTDTSSGVQSALDFLDQALRICEDIPLPRDQLQVLAQSSGQTWAAAFS